MQDNEIVLPKISNQKMLATACVEKTITKRASIAMAVYNGEKYINEQIDSIIEMMTIEDELIISYDESTDNTLAIINSYASEDSRIKIVFNKGKSVESNFNNAVANCSGKYIFLADQDDVWVNNKINVMVDYFEKNSKCCVLVSDGYITDEKLNESGELFREYKATPNPVRNFIKGTYLGCQMAFRSSIKEKVWPVSVNPALPHDLWLGVAGARYGKVELIHQKLIKHRLHESNYSNTSKMKLLGVIKNRIFFFYKLIIK